MRRLLPVIVFVSLRAGWSYMEQGYQCEFAEVERVWKNRTTIEQGFFCDIPERRGGRR